MMKLDKLAGLAGVADDEIEVARRWGRRFEWPMLLLAIWIPVQWYLEQTQALSGPLSVAADWVVWLLFVVETVTVTLLVRNKGTHLMGNWMNLVIIVAGLPLIWNVTPLAGMLRSLRLLLMMGILLRVSETLRQLFSRNKLGTTLLTSLAVVLVAGTLISGLDPAIDSPWEGIWWAWVTVTTVGYGDVVPVSAAGKFFGGLLILLGVGLFALLTANVSAFRIGRDVSHDETEIRERLQDIQQRLTRLEARLEKRESEGAPKSPSDEAPPRSRDSALD